MSRRTILVLRPERAAARTAETLAGLGLDAILAPVLSIEDLPNPIPDLAYDGVLATSANGLRKLTLRPEIERLRTLPLVAVGDRTAIAGREAGFDVVHVADGDGRSLVAETAARFVKPSRFLHAAGADRAFDVAGALQGHGHEVTVVELYKAEAATTLPETARRALESGQVAAVLQHSGRIATTFLTLADKAGVGDAARAAPQAAMSERIARPLRAAGCAKVAIAERLDEAALIDTLLTLIGDGSPTGAPGTK